MCVVLFLIPIRLPRQFNARNHSPSAPAKRNRAKEGGWTIVQHGTRHCSRWNIWPKNTMITNVTTSTHTHSGFGGGSERRVILVVLRVQSAVPKGLQWFLYRPPPFEWFIIVCWAVLQDDCCCVLPSGWYASHTPVRDWNGKHGRVHRVKQQIYRIRQF